MEAQEFVDRIDAERLDAAHMEHERLARVRGVFLVFLDKAIADASAIAARVIGDDELAQLVGHLVGMRDLLTGEWMVSPKAMRARRTGATDGTED